MSDFFFSTSFRLGHFLQAVVEERPMGEGDLSVQTEGMFGSRGHGCVTPLLLNWDDLISKKVEAKVYENSGAKPLPHSTFRLR